MNLIIIFSLFEIKLFRFILFCMCWPMGVSSDLSTSCSRSVSQSLRVLLSWPRKLCHSVCHPAPLHRASVAPKGQGVFKSGHTLTTLAAASSHLACGCKSDFLCGWVGGWSLIVRAGFNDAHTHTVPRTKSVTFLITYKTQTRQIEKTNRRN